MKDSFIQKLIWAVLIVVGMAFILFGCRTTEPQLQHCYNHEWQDVLVVDLPKGGMVVINGDQIDIPSHSEVILIGNVRN